MSILSVSLPRFPLVRPTDTPAPMQPIGDDRASQVLRRFSTYMPRSPTPAGLPGTRLYRSLRVGFCDRKNIASCITATYGAEYASGSAVSPLAYMFPCVRFVCFVRCYPVSRLADSTTLLSSLPLSFTHSGLMPDRSSR